MFAGVIILVRYNGSLFSLEVEQFNFQTGRFLQRNGDLCLIMKRVGEILPQFKLLQILAFHVTNAHRSITLNAHFKITIVPTNGTVWCEATKLFT